MKPAMEPIAVPMTMANAIAAKPMVREVRAPNITRLNTSRRLQSVPIRCCG